MKRPRSEIGSVIVHQRGDDGAWTPRRFEKGSWVILSAPKRGKWARQGDLIAQIKAFKFKDHSQVVESVLVAHAYTYKQLQLDKKPEGQINYIYPSTFEDWQDPASLVDLIVVTHADIGELTRGSRSYKDMLENSVFFYNAMYVPASKPGKFGKLISIPLPALDDPLWPIPDMFTSEAFRRRLSAEFQSAMNPKTGSRVCSVRWFMPFHIFADLFSVQSRGGMHRTPTLFVFKPVTDPLLASLMDDGWDTKTVAQKDIVRCHVLRENLSFRYHIGRSILYCSFGYLRHRLVGSEWVAMDSMDHVAMFSVEVLMLDGNCMSFQVGTTWTFGHLREEITFYGGDHSDTRWTFVIVTSSSRDKKVNCRQEKKMLISSVGDDCTLRLVSTSSGGEDPGGSSTIPVSAHLSSALT